MKSLVTSKLWNADPFGEQMYALHFTEHDQSMRVWIDGGVAVHHTRIDDGISGCWKSETHCLCADAEGVFWIACMNVKWQYAIIRQQPFHVQFKEILEITSTARK